MGWWRWTLRKEMHSSCKGQGGLVLVHAGRGGGFRYAGPVCTDIQKKFHKEKETN